MHYEHAIVHAVVPEALPTAGDRRAAAGAYRQNATGARLSRDVPILLYTHTQLMGGIAGYVMRLAGAFTLEGYRVAVLCGKGDAIAPMREALSQEGTRVHTVEMSDHSTLGRLRRVRDFVAVVRQYPGSVFALMMGDYNTGALISVAGALGGAGVIVRADLQPPMPPFDRRYATTHRVRDLLVDRTVVGAAENVRTMVNEIGLDAQKIDVVHTGIDLSRFEPTIESAGVRESLGLPAGAPIVGMVSRLEEDFWRKGADRFLDMAAHVAARFPEARFLVVGDGAARPRLQSQARWLELGDRVVFAGWRGDVPALLKEMTVFVMPSLHEGGPTSVLEAMAMGRAVVATSVGMVPEIMENERTGLIVQPGDVRAMGDAIARLLADKPLAKKLGANARATATHGFGFDTMVRSYLSVFARAIEAPRRIGARRGRGAT
jgi:glycosyltransferase involved in cell wall biosynthesis